MAHHVGTGWLPPNFRDWAADKLHKSRKAPLGSENWFPVIKDFQRLIEDTPAINMAFTRMFDQTMQNLDLRGQHQVKTYDEMLDTFNGFLREAPNYAEQRKYGGLIAFPFNAVIDWPMSSPAGGEVFTIAAVNDQLKKVFHEWATYLRSQASRDEVIVVTDKNGKPGWISEEALTDLLDGLTYIDGTKIEIKDFDKVYVCNPSDKVHFGFKSWDDFFIKPFTDSFRPVPPDLGNNVIVTACESGLNRIYMNVKKNDKFWVKSQPYSVSDILNHDPQYASQFGDGSAILQAFLSAKTYHRWNSPIDGTVVKSYVVPGTYYALCPSSDLDPSAPDLSQPFISQVATRALVFIQAEPEAVNIGLMCFVAIGMAEVSSCELTVYDGQKVSKGDQLGMFHHGGSSHCLIFRPETAKKIVWDQKVIAIPPTTDDPNKNYPQKGQSDKDLHLMLRQKLATVTAG